MTRLLIVRHAMTTANLEERYSGGGFNCPLCPPGEQQALALGIRLAGEPLRAIISSDLQRAVQSAQAIADYHICAVQYDADLREFNMGEWEGQSQSAILAEQSSLVVARQADPITYAPPGGETAVQVRDRVVRALSRWQTPYSHDTIVWVTHCGFAQILLCHLLGYDLRCWTQFQPDPASITELDLGPNQRGILRSLNDTTHLREGIEKKRDAFRPYQPTR